MSNLGQTASNPKSQTTLSQAINNLEDIENRLRGMTINVHNYADQVTGAVAEIRGSSKDSPSPPSSNIFQMVERIQSALNEHHAALERFHQ